MISMRILHCPDIQVVYAVYTTCKYCQSTTQIEGCPQSCIAPVTGTGDVCPLAATLALVVYGQDTTDSHAGYAILDFEKLCCRRNLTSAGQ
jgi:hypothetical protein